MNEWFKTVLNQPIEVHTFILGLFIGILLGIAMVKYRPLVTGSVIIGVVLAVFGGSGVHLICDGSYRICQQVQLKPWYFLAGIVLAHVLTLGAVEPGTRPTEEWPSTITPLLIVLAIATVGLAVYAAIRSSVRPVVELATVGCFAGAGVGIILLNWVDEEKTTDNYPLFNAVLTVDRRVVSHVVSFGIVFGFWYPWIAVESGKLLGVRSGTHTTSVSVATVMFAIVVSAVFIGCLFFMSVPLRDRRFEESHPLF